jgi:hypothetical protein
MVLAMIAAIGATAKGGGKSVEVADLTINSSTRYLQRMNLFAQLGVDAGISVTEHEAAGRFIPVRNILDNAELNDFIKDFVPLLHMDPHDADAVKYVLFELLRNVLEHAGSQQGAFVAAQVIPGQSTASRRSCRRGHRHPKEHQS